MAGVIRLHDALVQLKDRKKKYHSVFRMHGTYFQARRSGLNDPAATQFPHFPNLIPN